MLGVHSVAPHRVAMEAVPAGRHSGETGSAGVVRSLHTEWSGGMTLAVPCSNSATVSCRGSGSHNQATQQG